MILSKMIDFYLLGPAKLTVLSEYSYVVQNVGLEIFENQELSDGAVAFSTGLTLCLKDWT